MRATSGQQGPSQVATDRASAIARAPAGGARDAGRRVTATRQAAGARAASPRRYPRFPLRVEITYASEHNFFSGMLQNIGGGGLFIATSDLLPLGARLEVEFSVPGREASCLASCEVAWQRDSGAVHAAAGGIAGMGLRFVELAPDVAEAVQRFIQHREPIFFEDS